jgi:hypothetical protein
MGQLTVVFGVTEMQASRLGSAVLVAAPCRGFLYVHQKVVAIPW